MVLVLGVAQMDEELPAAAAAAARGLARVVGRTLYAGQRRHPELGVAAAKDEAAMAEALKGGGDGGAHLQCPSALDVPHPWRCMCDSALGGVFTFSAA